MWRGGSRAARERSHERHARAEPGVIEQAAEANGHDAAAVRTLAQDMGPLPTSPSDALPPSNPPPTGVTAPIRRRFPFFFRRRVNTPPDAVPGARSQSAAAGIEDGGVGEEPTTPATGMTSLAVPVADLPAQVAMSTRSGHPILALMQDTIAPAGRRSSSFSSVPAQNDRSRSPSVHAWGTSTTHAAASRPIASLNPGISSPVTDLSAGRASLAAESARASATEAAFRFLMEEYDEERFPQERFPQHVRSHEFY